MTTLSIAWKNLRHNLASSVLGVLLTVFGTGILTILLLTSGQLEEQLDRNSRSIDLVIGAKGSPMQLILSSIYHTDYPTGNIDLAEAMKVADNPLVKMAVPLSLGDNYRGYRMVGTDSSFLALYDASLKEGGLWKKNFEVVIGSEVAAREKLKPGDRIFSSHGMSHEGHVHDEHPYIVTGILKPTHSIADRLVLSDLESVWVMHGQSTHHDHSEEHEHTQEHDHGDAHPSEPEGLHEHLHHHGEEETHIHEEEAHARDLLGPATSGKEITSLLIRYRSPAAIAMFPRLVNQTTGMQAASPAIESARLFSLIGIGIDTLQYLAIVIMLMALLSIFISLYHALKTRKFDLAIMRTLGASQGKLFTIIITEGMLITLTGTLLGIAAGHIVLYFISIAGENSASLLNALQVDPREGWLLLAGILSGFFAAIIPAVSAYRTSISKTLSTS